MAKPTIEKLVYLAHQNSLDKGFWDSAEGDPFGAPNIHFLAMKLALVHSEVTEALEELRNGLINTVTSPDGKPEGLGTELADIVIRVFDLAGWLGIAIDDEIINKMAYNEGRPHMHGKAF